MTSLKFFYVLVYGLTAFFLGSAISACSGDFDVTPVIEPGVIDARTYTVFIATYDGVEVDANDAVFTCIDGFLYLRSDLGVVVSGTDGVDDTCVPDLLSRTAYGQTDRPLLTE